jgi:hypothetical protein
MSPPTPVYSRVSATADRLVQADQAVHPLVGELPIAPPDQDVMAVHVGPVLRVGEVISADSVSEVDDPERAA